MIVAGHPGLIMVEPAMVLAGQTELNIHCWRRWRITARLVLPG